MRSDARPGLSTFVLSPQRPRLLASTIFAQMYNCYRNKIYKYIYSKIGIGPEAEDLTAQVFMKAWQAIDRYRWTERPFSAWLYRIAHNLVVDYYRTHNETVSLDDLPFEPETGAEPLDLATLRNLRADALRQAIAQLTDGQQQVIVLKFLEGYSTRETARIIRKDTGAVRALQHRALAMLKRVCEP